MRLNEIADPNEYKPTAAETEKFLNQLARPWPGRLPDDLSPSVPQNRKPPPRERGKLFDAL
jgi:hypothetical protein